MAGSENSRRDSALETIARELTHTNRLLEQLVDQGEKHVLKFNPKPHQLEIDGTNAAE